MLYSIFGLTIRIFSNSYLNVFQKKLTTMGEKTSVINFYTYFGLSIISIWFLKNFAIELIPLILLMGLLGSLGNYFIIKALSVGELSTLAPINSYKPLVALLFGIIFLQEIPTLNSLFGLFFIILGTFVILNTKKKANKQAILYRILALIFSGSEAIVIKKIILYTSPLETFIYWILGGLFFSTIFLLFSKHKPIIKSFKYQLLLIFSVALMQYSTNYVFSKMNVSHALALFQLSTLLSVILGIKLFNEKELTQKIIGSIIMILGAILVIMN